MPDTVTLNVISTDQSTRTETIQVSNKDLIKCIFPSFNGKDITSVEYHKVGESVDFTRWDQLYGDPQKGEKVNFRYDKIAKKKWFG